VRLPTTRNPSGARRVDESSDPAPPLWPDFFILCLLTAVYVGGYVLSSAIPDTTRDIYAAYEISRGRWFPLQGPVLGWAIHASPFWYYLLAIPLLFVASWTGVALFVGVISGLKFFLAYKCGTRLINRTFGLVWSIALAMPGWTTVQHLTFFTPNIVETGILLSLYLAIRLSNSPSSWKTCVLGLLCGLAMNAHPTAVPILLISLGVVLRVTRGWQRATALALFCCACAVPFIPYVIDQALHGAPDIFTGASYVESNIRFSRVKNIPDILRGTAFDGPLLIARYIVGISGTALLALRLLLAVAIAALVLGLIRCFRESSQARSELFAVLGGVALFSLAIAMFRPNTPCYFVYALTPPLAALVAISICAFARWTRSECVVYCFAGVVIALHSIVIGRIGGVMHEGVGTLPLAMADVTTAAESPGLSDIWLPSFAHDDAGRFLCESGDGIIAHGPMAYLVDRNVGVDTLVHCDRATTVQIGGMRDGARHVAGMPRSYWDALSRSPQCWLGPLGLADAASVFSTPDKLPNASGRDYPPRAILAPSQTLQTRSFEAPGNEALLLTNVISGYMPWEIVAVKVNGRLLEPIAATYVSSLYAPPEPRNAGKVVWDVEFHAVDPRMVDAVTLSLPPSNGRSVPSCDGAGLGARKAPLQ